MRPYILSIAGFDPSSGAGLLADIKTFEIHKSYGLAVCTSITYQNDVNFVDITWLEPENIFKQIEILYQRFKFNFVKIGLIHNINILNESVQYLKNLQNKTVILWDPILKASTGYSFHKKIDFHTLLSVLKKIDLITPNINEAKKIFGNKYEQKIKQLINSENICSVLVKSYLTNQKQHNDKLFTEKKEYILEGKHLQTYKKHGSGCVYSSAILANLAKGDDLYKACSKAKEFIIKFLSSNKTLLGYIFI